MWKSYGNIAKTWKGMERNHGNLDKHRLVESLFGDIDWSNLDSRKLRIMKIGWPMSTGLMGWQNWQNPSLSQTFLLILDDFRPWLVEICWSHLTRSARSTSHRSSSYVRKSCVLFWSVVAEFGIQLAFTDGFGVLSKGTPSIPVSVDPAIAPAADFCWWLIFVGDWLNARVDILARAMVKAPCWLSWCFLCFTTGWAPLC